MKWVRGHPERRKSEDEWSVIEWGNHWVDKAADEAYKREWNWGGSRSRVKRGVAVRAGKGWIHGKLRRGLTEWVREKVGDKYLHESGNGVAVEEKDRVLETIMTEIRSKHDACTRGEGCKRMYLGKGTKERKMRREKGTVQSAMCVMIGFWSHAVRRAESTGGDERQVRLGREDRQQRSGRKRSQPPETRERAKKSKKSRQSSSVASAPSDGAGQSAGQSVRLITELLARTDVGIEGPEPLDTG